MAIAKSGHRSRTSSKNGLRRSAATHQADIAWKIGGVVPITRSTSRTRSPTTADATANQRNAMMRQANPR